MGEFDFIGNKHKLYDDKDNILNMSYIDFYVHDYIDNLKISPLRNIQKVMNIKYFYIESNQYLANPKFLPDMAITLAKNSMKMIVDDQNYLNLSDYSIGTGKIARNVEPLNWIWDGLTEISFLNFQPSYLPKRWLYVCFCAILYKTYNSKLSDLSILNG